MHDSICARLFHFSFSLESGTNFCSPLLCLFLALSCFISVEEGEDESEDDDEDDISCVP